MPLVRAEYRRLSDFCFDSADAGYILKYFVDGLSNPGSGVVPHGGAFPAIAEPQAVPLLIILIAAWQGLGSFRAPPATKVSGLVHDLRVQLFNNLLTLPNAISTITTPST